MSNNHFSEIKTERLLLRHLKQTDWEMISYLRTDKEVNKFVKRPTAETKGKALEFIAKISDGINKQNLYYWSITHNLTMVGTICLWNFSEDKKTAEVGYDLSSKFQGKGIMSEALKSVLNFGFHNLNLSIIEAYTHKKNESSKKLLKKNNFKLIKGKSDEYNKDNIVYKIDRKLNI